MAEIDYMPTLKEITAIRVLGYTGTNKVDAVVRWFRTEKEIIILPEYHFGFWLIKVYFGTERGVKQIICHTKFEDYTTAAVAGINKSVFYLENIRKQANITFRQLS